MYLHLGILVARYGCPASFHGGPGHDSGLRRARTILGVTFALPLPAVISTGGGR